MQTRLELINLFEQKKLTNKGVEVGSFKGEYAKEMLKVWTGNLYLVDVWHELDINQYSDCSNQVDYENIILQCCKNIKGNEDRCFMIRSNSESAVQLFDDNSLDFVYIDANHKYEFVKKDIELWFPKVRRGGIVSGHDYLMLDWYNDKNFAENNKDKYIYNSFGFVGEFGVNPAVDEFCTQHGYSLNLTNEWFGTWFITK